MHCIIQIVTKGEPSWEQIHEIMNPYYEDDFYKQYYDEEKDEFLDIPPEDYPPFLWDYWSPWEEAVPSAEADIGNCFAMIDRQGRAHVRSYWNGQEHVDCQKDFEYWIKRIIRERGPNDYVTTLNYHW